MRQGFEEILHNAAQEVEYVTDYLTELSSVEETRKLWRAWSGLLEHYVKAVSALRRATDQGKSKGWSDSLLANQRADPILQYAFQSRDHASHVFEGKREASPRAVSLEGFISLSGNSSGVFSNNKVIGPDGKVHKLPEGTMSISDGRYAGGTIPKESIIELEHYVILTEVKTRSGVWPIPNPQTKPSEQALEIAQYVANWLTVRLGEAQEMSQLARDKE